MVSSGLVALRWLSFALQSWEVVDGWHGLVYVLPPLTPLSGLSSFGTGYLLVLVLNIKLKLNSNTLWENFDTVNMNTLFYL